MILSKVLLNCPTRHWRSWLLFLDCIINARKLDNGKPLIIYSPNSFVQAEVWKNWFELLGRERAPKKNVQEPIDSVANK